MVHNDGMKTPSRSVALAGATNFRDLGGYVGKQGRLVKWRKLFRSDHLGLLTTADVAQLADLNLSRVFDLRGVKERVAHPFEAPGVAVHSLSIEPTVVQALHDFAAKNKTLTAQVAAELMQQTYRDFVTHNSARFKELFAHLLERDSPLVFHCTAGKDRTGFAAALILLALGVQRDAVMQDYMLTNALYKAPDLVGGGAPPEVRAVIATVREDFLNAALDVVDAEHGSVADYLEYGLGLGPREQAHLLELYLQH
jgi:protein-tyrosine phosphatase